MASEKQLLNRLSALRQMTESLNFLNSLDYPEAQVRCALGVFHKIMSIYSSEDPENIEETTLLQNIDFSIFTDEHDGDIYFSFKAGVSHLHIRVKDAVVPYFTFNGHLKLGNDEIGQHWKSETVGPLLQFRPTMVTEEFFKALLLQLLIDSE